MPPGAMRFPEPLPDIFRLVGSPFLLGAMRCMLLWFSLIAWRYTSRHQAPYQNVTATSFLAV